MGTRTVGLITALATAPALGAVASPGPSTAVPEANSYADLLEPIPNAVERLRAADAAEMARPARLIDAQYHHHHHHHHHHHNSYGRYYSNPYYSNPYYSGSYYYGTPYYSTPYYEYPNYNYQGYGYRGYSYPRGRDHHHHHHHHSSYPR